MPSSSLSVGWIRTLAAPYLRGYRAQLQKIGALRGYWFRASASKPKGRGHAGFFVGYLLEEGEYAFLSPLPPECLAFAFVHPVGSPGHKRAVVAKDALVRKTSTYIRWLTHRPPRFVFHDDQIAVLTRHQSMRDWPREKREHFSRNFFIETLAWLVRSGLVRKLPEAVSGARRPSRS